MTHFKARNLTALLLVLVLLVSMFSTTALAAEDEYITDFEAESEIIIEEEPTEELPEDVYKRQPIRPNGCRKPLLSCWRRG